MINKMLFPYEIYEKIFSNFDRYVLFKCLLVCRYWFPVAALVLWKDPFSRYDYPVPFQRLFYHYTNDYDEEKYVLLKYYRERFRVRSGAPLMDYFRYVNTINVCSLRRIVYEKLYIDEVKSYDDVDDLLWYFIKIIIDRSNSDFRYFNLDRGSYDFSKCVMYEGFIDIKRGKLMSSIDRDRWDYIIVKTRDMYDYENLRIGISDMVEIYFVNSCYGMYCRDFLGGISCLTTLTGLVISDSYIDMGDLFDVVEGMNLDFLELYLPESKSSRVIDDMSDIIVLSKKSKVKNIKVGSVKKYRKCNCYTLLYCKNL